MITRTPTPHSYSAAVAAGDFVFLGLHRGFGETFAAQLAGAMTGVGQTLGGHGVGLDTLVRVTVWLRDIVDLPAMEEAFLDWFEPGGFPARMTATTQFIDEDCLVMVEGVAYRGRGSGRPLEPLPPTDPPTTSQEVGNRESTAL